MRLYHHLSCFLIQYAPFGLVKTRRPATRSVGDAVPALVGSQLMPEQRSARSGLRSSLVQRFSSGLTRDQLAHDGVYCIRRPRVPHPTPPASPGSRRKPPIDRTAGRVPRSHRIPGIGPRREALGRVAVQSAPRSERFLTRPAWAAFACNLSGGGDGSHRRR